MHRMRAASHRGLEKLMESWARLLSGLPTYGEQRGLRFLTTDRLGLGKVSKTVAQAIAASKMRLAKVRDSRRASIRSGHNDALLK